MQATLRRAALSRVTLMLAVVPALILGLGTTDRADAAENAVRAAPQAVVISEASCEGDWVEIQNTDTLRSADIGKWMVADSLPATPASAFTFPKGKLLKPGARLVLKISVLPFRLGCGSDNIYLARTKTLVVDRVAVPNLLEGLSWGRVGEGWQATVPTPGGANQAAPTGTVADRAAWIYAPLRSYQIRLTIEPAALQSLVITPKTYVPAKFQMEGVDGSLLPAAGPLNIGVRVKGSIGTLTHRVYGPGGLTIAKDKVGLKLKFNFSVKGQHFFGLEKLTLNSMVQDPTMTHETLAYRLFREAGVTAARTGFANLYINGTLRGLFLNLEPYDEVSMTWHVPDLQHVYEGQTTDLTPQLTSAALAVAFDVDGGSKTNTDDLKALVKAVEASTTITPALAAKLDIDRFGAFLAVEKFINHWDGYSGSVPWGPNNFYLIDDARGRFRFAPSGVDATWQYYTDVEGLDAQGGEHLGSGDGSLFARCLTEDRCASAYRRTLAFAADQAPTYLQYAKTLRTTHEAARLADTVRRSSASYEAWSWDQQLKFLVQRPLDVSKYLANVVTGKLRWAPPSLRLAKGSALTSTQLNAYSDVPGTISYSVPLGRRLPLGKTTVTATLTPTDTTRAPQSMSITFTVA